MPSRFEQRMSRSLKILHAQFDVTGKYSGPDGAEVDSISFRVQRADVRQVDRKSDVSGELQTASIFVMQSALPKPARGGRFTVEGGVEVWTIDNTPKLQNGQWYLQCKRSGAEKRMERRVDNA